MPCKTLKMYRKIKSAPKQWRLTRLVSVCHGEDMCRCLFRGGQMSMRFSEFVMNFCGRVPCAFEKFVWVFFSFFAENWRHDRDSIS